MTEFSIRHKFLVKVCAAETRLSDEDSQLFKVFDDEKASVQTKALAIILGREKTKLYKILNELYGIAADWTLDKLKPKTAWDIELEVWKKFCWDGKEESLLRFCKKNQF